MCELAFQFDERTNRSQRFQLSLQYQDFQMRIGCSWSMLRDFWQLLRSRFWVRKTYRRDESRHSRLTGRDSKEDAKIQISWRQSVYSDERDKSYGTSFGLLLLQRRHNSVPLCHRDSFTSAGTGVLRRHWNDSTNLGESDVPNRGYNKATDS